MNDLIVMFYIIKTTCWVDILKYYSWWNLSLPGFVVVETGGNP